MTHDAFVDAVQDRLQLDDPEDTIRRTKVVLETFSEILYRTERDKVSAPLPKELKRRLHAAKPENTRQEIDRLNANSFLDRIQARADLNREDAKTTVHEVLSVLEEAVGADILSEIGDQLPSSYGAIFPFASAPDSAGPSTV
jgi:uncharacterized protein (DUF2267 family)